MNPIHKLWVNIKRAYLFVLYWLVGLEDDYYLMMKAYYRLELEDYPGAIRYCEKALKTSNHAFIHYTLAECYTQIGKYDTSAEYYRTVYTDIDNPKAALRLAYEELQSGNLDNSSELINMIKRMKNKLNSTDERRLGHIEEELAMAERGREELKKYKKPNKSLDE